MHDLPIALLESLEKRKDFSKDSFLKAHEEPAVVSIRTNPIKPYISPTHFFSITSIPWNPYGCYLEDRPAFVFDPLLHAGVYYVQEASSMFIWEVLKQLNIASNSKVLDLCAAPGGKTTLLASFFSDGLVVGNEVIKSRASVLVENATKWGSGNIVVTNNDPKHFEQLPGFFDVLLVDAPCSGSGLFRKETDWREGWSDANVHLCSQRQQRILADVYPSLKEDGIFIYSTCSFSQEEDEDIVDWIMEEFQMENIPLQLNGKWGIEETISEKKQGRSYRFYPGKTKGEGFFISVFRKKQPSGYSFSSEKLALSTSSEKAILDKWVQNAADLMIYKNGNVFHAIPQAFQEDLTILKNKLYLRKGGTELGVIKGKDLVPSHELALSKCVNKSIVSYDLHYKEAIQYLRKNDLERKDDMPNGWVLISFEKANLGWVKILPNRINNYYPIDWRIRKQ